MDLDRFWELVEAAAAVDADCQAQADRLTTMLEQLAPEETVSFERALHPAAGRGPPLGPVGAGLQAQRRLLRRRLRVLPLLDAWLLTDERAELGSQLRRLAAEQGLRPHAGSFQRGALRLDAHPVVHTSHPTFGYLIEAPEGTVVWAPEFFEFPGWAHGVGLLFAEAAGWERPIRFAGGVGGHLHVPAVAEAARRHRVGRLVFAHIGRPTIRAIDRGARPAFGEFARDGQVFRVTGQG